MISAPSTPTCARSRRCATRWRLTPASLAKRLRYPEGVSSFAVLALFATALPNAVVLRPVANMYSGPTADADVVSQAIYGANVQLMEQIEGWAHVRTADEYTGWIAFPELRPGAPDAVSGRVAEVMSQFAHIYREADVTRHAP